MRTVMKFAACVLMLSLLAGCASLREAQYRSGMGPDGIPDESNPYSVIYRPPTISSLAIAMLPEKVCVVQAALNRPLEYGMHQDLYGAVVDPILCQTDEYGGEMMDRNDHSHDDLYARIIAGTIAVLDEKDTLMLMHCTKFVHGLNHPAGCDEYNQTHYWFDPGILHAILSGKIEAADLDRTATDVCSGDAACISKYKQIYYDVERQIDDASH